MLIHSSESGLFSTLETELNLSSEISGRPAGVETIIPLPTTGHQSIMQVEILELSSAAL